MAEGVPGSSNCWLSILISVIFLFKVYRELCNYCHSLANISSTERFSNFVINCADIWVIAFFVLSVCWLCAGELLVVSVVDWGAKSL